MLQIHGYAIARNVVLWIRYIRFMFVCSIWRIVEIELMYGGVRQLMKIEI